MTAQPDIIWNEQCLGIRIGEQVCTYLKKHDAEYQRLQNKILELTERYPVIETFMESNQAISLTTEEHKAVHQYFRLESEKEMIEEQLKTAASDYSYDGGLKAVISVPMGIQIAKKTFNPRLGIEGGISILGTTGIVEPMSEQALIDTISVELDVRKAQNEEFIIVTPGNYGQDFLRDNLCIAVDKCVKCSNFIGDTIDMCIEKGFKSMLLVGHIGKLSKLGCTIYNTHSRYADGRMEAFALCAALCGAEREVLENILGCITTDAALKILKKEGIFDETIKMLEKRIDRSLKLRAKGSIEIGMITFSEEYGILCKTENADNMLEKLK